MKKLLLVILIIALAVGAFYIYKKSKNQSMMTTPTQKASPTTSASPSAATTPTSQNVVTLTANGFTPSTLTISAGQSVTWINKSGAAATVNSDPHPTHTNYPPLNLGTFADGQSLSLTFLTVGTYAYHNHLNPSQTGTIVVK